MSAPVTGPLLAPPVCSVVVPAHDEERVIARCLDPLAELVACGSIDVVVVANGCSDGTAAVASGYRGVRVVELVEASKVAALNAGEAACRAWPRIVLDADVVLSSEALLALAEALTTPEAVIGSVRLSFVTQGRPWMVRAFYRAFADTPYVTDQLVGLGLYGFSQAGRQRFDSFPDLVADDLFVQRLFAPSERRVVGDHQAVVQVPRTVAALLAVRTRVAAGNAQLADEDADRGARSTSSTLKRLLHLILRQPWRSGDVLVYLAVNALARRRARRVEGRVWHRDVTTREPDPVWKDADECAEATS